MPPSGTMMYEGLRSMPMSVYFCCSIVCCIPAADCSLISSNLAMAAWDNLKHHKTSMSTCKFFQNNGVDTQNSEKYIIQWNSKKYIIQWNSWKYIMHWNRETRIIWNFSMLHLRGICNYNIKHPTTYLPIQSMQKNFYEWLIGGCTKLYIGI